MSEELKHECAVALVVLRKDGEHYREKHSTGDYGGVKLSLLLEKQHNRGQDGAGAAILSANPEAGSAPYQIFKSASATALADVLGMLTKRCSAQTGFERVFLGHLRYATFGRNEESFCHPFVHAASELEHTLLLAGNFNLTNAHELFDDYRRHGSFPTSKADGYLVCEMIAKSLRGEGLHDDDDVRDRKPDAKERIAAAIGSALDRADGAWTLCGMTGDGWSFATRDPHGIRPCWYYVSDEVVAVASERPAIQAAFDVPPEAVSELAPGEALVVSPDGDVAFERLFPRAAPKSCLFERIYFSRANDADIHRERKALGAALVPQIIKAANAPMERIFFSYIPNSARIAFHGLLEKLFSDVFSTGVTVLSWGMHAALSAPSVKNIPRFGEVAVKDAKFRTFIADAAARREFYKHVYDVTYGLVDKDDTLVVLDDSIVRGNTMKNAILPMLDRLGPKRIVVASSAPPIRYPDCYGIDMSTLGELVAFRALVNLLDGESGTGNGERELRAAIEVAKTDGSALKNPLAPLYARFSDEQHCAEIARLLTPPDMKAEVVVVFQSVATLHAACPGNTGDWYFTGNYPTPGGYVVLHKALENFLGKKFGRSY